jgi:hypothetical protein
MQEGSNRAFLVEPVRGGHIDAGKLAVSNGGYRALDRRRGIGNASLAQGREQFLVLAHGASLKESDSGKSLRTLLFPLVGTVGKGAGV